VPGVANIVTAFAGHTLKPAAGAKAEKGASA